MDDITSRARHIMAKVGMEVVVIVLFVDALASDGIIK